MVTGLSSLPLELLHQIASYLPIPALISLKLINPELYCSIRLPAWFQQLRGKDGLQQLPACEQRAVHRYLNERRERQYGRRRCILCDTLQPLDGFLDDGQACSFHQARLRWASNRPRPEAGGSGRLVSSHPSAPESDSFRSESVICGHTKEIIGGDVRSCGCGCDSCSHCIVKCYTRFPSETNSAELTFPESHGP